MQKSAIGALQKRQNELRDGKKDGIYDKSEPNDIQSIIDTYKNRPEKIESYSRRVSMGEIAKNGYNLNISRYVSTAEDEIQIDLKEVNKNLSSINGRIEEKTKEHNKFLKELGLPKI